MKTLSEEVQRFKLWASTSGHFGEWETNFPFWEDLWGAAEIALKELGSIEAVQDDLLYVLARDNECERIRDMLVEYPDIGIELAKLGGTYSDRDARWQLADFLGTQSGEEARSLACQYLVDQDEYVRRRALASVIILDPVVAESTAFDWLESEFEYSRLVAIRALHSLRSEMLPAALGKLKEDSSSFVREAISVISGAV